MPAQVYRITVEGEMGPAMREAFSDISVSVGDGQTVLTAELTDQAALHAIFERLQALGLDLVRVTTAEPDV